MFNTPKTQTKTICFVVHRLTGGGAERNLVRVANHLSSQEDFEVSLIILWPADREDIFPDSSIKVVRLKETSRSRFFVPIRKRIEIRRAITQQKYDLVVSFAVHVNLMLLTSLIGTRVKVIVSERNNPLQDERSRSTAFQERIFYPFARRVVLLAEELGEVWASKKWPRWHYTAIANPIPDLQFAKFDTSDVPDLQKDRKILLAMGRMVYQKGFDLLLPCFARLHRKHSDWDLHLVGEGPDREKLEEMARELGIESRVFFHGWSTKPYEWYQVADLFAFPSRFEGFGMTLGEALSAGLPAVAFSCPYGPSRIVDDGVNGFLVPPGDLERLEECLDSLMVNEKMRKNMGELGPLVLKRYSIEVILHQWEETIRNSVGD